MRPPDNTTVQVTERWVQSVGVDAGGPSDFIAVRFVYLPSHLCGLERAEDEGADGERRGGSQSSTPSPFARLLTFPTASIAFSSSFGMGTSSVSGVCRVLEDSVSYGCQVAIEIRSPLPAHAEHAHVELRYNVLDGAVVETQSSHFIWPSSDLSFDWVFEPQASSRFEVIVLAPRTLPGGTSAPISWMPPHTIALFEAQNPSVNGVLDPRLPANTFVTSQQVRQYSVMPACNARAHLPLPCSTGHCDAFERLVGGHRLAGPLHSCAGCSPHTPGC